MRGFDIPLEQLESGREAEEERDRRLYALSELANDPDLGFQSRIARERNILGFERIGDGPAGVIG